MNNYPNWFQQTGKHHFEYFLSEFKGQKGLRFLQLGVFVGHASKWLVDNILTDPTSILIDVDTWEGSPEHEETWDWEKIEQEYDRTVYHCHGNVDKFRVSARDFFRTTESRIPFDFIYIDASHEAVNVMEDAVNSYRALKVGGLLAFDDYTWAHSSGSPALSPGLAIDMVKYLYAGRLMLVGLDTQAWFRKIA